MQMVKTKVNTKQSTKKAKISIKSKDLKKIESVTEKSPYTDKSDDAFSPLSTKTSFNNCLKVSPQTKKAFPKRHRNKIVISAPVEKKLMTGVKKFFDDVIDKHELIIE